MAYYIRKVTSSKWKGELPKDGNHLLMGTDGITNCCRTSENDLSIWLTHDTDPSSDETEKVIAAIAAAAERPSSVDFIFISDEEISSIGLTLKKVDGKTPIKSMACFHRDIENLDVDKIGRLGMVIHKKVTTDGNLYKFGKIKIRELIKKHFPNGSEHSDKVKNRTNWENIYD